MPKSKKNNRHVQDVATIIEIPVSELHQSIWAVIDQNNCMVCNVAYNEAEDFGNTLLDRKHTIVTADVAKRLCGKSNCQTHS